MAQTLQAVLGFGLISVLVFVTLRHQTETEVRNVSGDVEVQARGVATEALERLVVLPFDGGEGAISPLAGELASVAKFSPASAFGPAHPIASGSTLQGVLTGGTVNDLDDVHGLNHVVVTREVLDPETGAPRLLSFNLSIGVQYASRSGSNWVAAPRRSLTKQVFVRVEQDHLRGPVTLTRLVSSPA